MREFRGFSDLYENNLALAIAPALTPEGIDDNPDFFSGEIIRPHIFARSLLVLSEIVSTRYFKPAPVSFKDPVLSAQGECLRAECFSACNGVYARLDLFQEALYGDIAFGTTNVDIGTELRNSLANVKQEDSLKLKIGAGGLNAFYTGSSRQNSAKITEIYRQRPVRMPDRWLRALGNVTAVHKDMKPVFSVKGTMAKSFIASLPSSSSKEQSGWLHYTKTGIRLMPRGGPGAVCISGLNRLSALKRVMTQINSIVFYASQEDGYVSVEVGLEGMNIILGLTAKTYQGYSGEGSLLESLSSGEISDNADSVASMLKFQAKINESELAGQLNLSLSEVKYALALLSSYGRLGYDIKEEKYFHRELPEEPERVLKDNPRLLSARSLVENCEQISDSTWLVHSKDADYRVIYDRNESLDLCKCTCSWYLAHKNSRGPCKHILAVKLKTDKESEN